MAKNDNLVIENENGFTLVRTNTSTNDGFWFERLQHKVEVGEVVSNDDVLALWGEANGITVTSKEVNNAFMQIVKTTAKEWIARIEGYAYSTCHDPVRNIQRGDIVKFKII